MEEVRSIGAENRRAIYTQESNHRQHNFRTLDHEKARRYGQEKKVKQGILCVCMLIKLATNFAVVVRQIH